MGLDVYTGSLTRYLAGDWELVAQKAARELGVPLEIVRKNEAEDAIRDPDQIRPVVQRWRDNLSEALRDKLSNPFDWDEASEAPYFTDKPTWDCYAALMLWAAYDEQRHLNRPFDGPAEWGDDLAYKASTATGYQSRYSQLYNVALWLPCDFQFVFQAEFITGSEMLIGSSRELSLQLDILNQRTWSAKAATLEQWNFDGAEKGVPLETSARFAFSIFKSLADQSNLHRVPMVLDW